MAKSGHLVTNGQIIHGSREFTGLQFGPHPSFSVQCEYPAVWNGDGSRAAVAKMLRLDDVVEAPCFPIHCQDVALIVDVERMAAASAITAPEKKTPRH